MATTYDTEVEWALHRVATALAAMDFMDQEKARQISQIAEAVAEMSLVLYYQAETGRATPTDFVEAQAAICQAKRVYHIM